MRLLTRLAIKFGIYKEIVTEKVVLIKPETSLKNGDRVFVKYLNNTKFGHIKSEAFIADTLRGLTSPTENIVIEFDDGSIDSPPLYLVHRA